MIKKSRRTDMASRNCLAAFSLVVCIWGSLVARAAGGAGVDEGYIQRQELQQNGGIKVPKRSLLSTVQSDECGINTCMSVLNGCCFLHNDFHNCLRFPDKPVDIWTKFEAGHNEMGPTPKLHVQWNSISNKNLGGYKVDLFSPKGGFGYLACRQVIIDNKAQEPQLYHAVEFNVQPGAKYSVKVKPLPFKDGNSTVEKNVTIPGVCEIVEFTSGPGCRCLIENLRTGEVRVGKEANFTVSWDLPCNYAVKRIDILWSYTNKKDLDNCSGVVEQNKIAHSFDISIPGNCMKYNEYMITVKAHGSEQDNKMEKSIEVTIPTEGGATYKPTEGDIIVESTSSHLPVVGTALGGGLIGIVLIFLVIKFARKAHSPLVLLLPNVQESDLDMNGGSVTMFQGSIRLVNYEWNEEYRNMNSDTARSLSNKVRNAIEQIYTGSLAFREFRVLSFRPGSLIADFTLSLGHDLVQEQELTKLYEAVKGEMLGDLKVDPTTFRLTVNTEVLIMCQHCCDDCDKVLCALKNALTSTGLFKVSLDLCDLTSVAENINWWFEKEAKNADKILVIASQNLPRDPRRGPLPNIMWQLNNFIQAHMRDSWTLPKLIPAYFNYNGNESDVPRPLMGKIIHRLPEGLDHLVCFLKNVEPVRSNSRNTRIEVGYPDHPYNEKKERLSEAVRCAQRYHQSRQNDNGAVMV